MRTIHYLRQRHPRALEGFHDSVFPLDLHGTIGGVTIIIVSMDQTAQHNNPKHLVCAWEKFAGRLFANN